MQILRGIKWRIGNYQENPGLQLALCSTDPTSFRTNVRAHIVTMAPHGFNAHALGVLASRAISLFLRSPQDLQKRFVMLREVFSPCGDELADDIDKMEITRECLPAVALGADDVTGDYRATSDRLAISRLHKVMLSGPGVVLHYTLPGLERSLDTLVAAGLCATGADARRQCMSQSALISAYSLSWYLERKAAVLEAGGTMSDVRAACCRSGGTRASLPCVLLWQQSKCAPLHGATTAEFRDDWFDLCGIVAASVAHACFLFV